MSDWSRWPNFSITEMRCKHTGKDGMHPEFMDRLQALRVKYARPMKITSAYRHETHPVEAKKRTPGAHTKGRAVDVAVLGADAYRLVQLATEFGFTGIGVSQKPDGARFIHLDDVTSKDGFARPALWSY
jgi:zinc D-Ala-D-Ala carboxypeptidase